jgi:hypothetical protein
MKLVGKNVGGEKICGEKLDGDKVDENKLVGKKDGQQFFSHEKFNANFENLLQFFVLML